MEMGQGTFLVTGPNRREISARAMGTEKEEKATEWNYSTVKSAQRLSANIIDTSEWTCANYIDM